jgi:hypothetical protein
MPEVVLLGITADTYKQGSQKEKQLFKFQRG